MWEMSNNNNKNGNAAVSTILFSCIAICRHDKRKKKFLLVEQKSAEL